MGAVVEAVDLKKASLLGKVPVEALRGVNLKVKRGDFLAILGPSGSDNQLADLAIRVE